MDISENPGETLTALRRQNERLRAIVDLLPVGATVQSEDGRFMLVNAAAAAQLGVPSETLIGATPAAFMTEREASQRRMLELALIEAGKSASAEEPVTAAGGARTLLTTRKPVRVRDETLLLSTSLDITERKRMMDDLVRRAYFDDLTGLPNRILLQERINDLLDRKAGSGRFALAFIDVDNFKHINDYYSHAAGDALLAEVAQRIGETLRASDLFARISGDEFVLVLDPIGSEGELRATLDHLLHQLKRPFFIDGFEILTSASIGVSIFPDHGRHYEALRRNADSAMYRAKSRAKGSAVLFDRDIGQAVASRMELEQRLRLAIRDRRFCCAFQPKVDIRTHEVSGVEALIRWRDEHGLIQAPGAFVSVAVELGLIDEIAHLVLAECTKAMELIDDAFGAGTSISINIAAKQANDLDFMRAFADALVETGCAERFMLELTEDAFVAKSEFQTDVLPMLRKLGVRVSIDDFGTGYSSLSALADITADEIKVDRSFITDIHLRPRSQSVLKAIESLSHALAMTVVAEGVETFEEVAYLQAATRIRVAQGYYFAKPLFLEEFESGRRMQTESRSVQAARERPELRSSQAQRAVGAGSWRRD